MLRPAATADSLIGQKVFRKATLWKMQRTDGAVFRFTDHNEVLKFQDETYEPSGAAEISATRLSDSLEAQNLEAQGVITSDAITVQDLRNGLWRNTKVTEYIVDWLYPLAGPMVTSVYWLTEGEWTDEVFAFQVEGIGRWLSTEVGHLYTRNCRHDLGAGHSKGINCRVNLGLFSFASVELTSITSNTDFVVSTTQVPSSTSRNRLRFGKVMWVKGNNKGFTQEIVEYGSNRVQCFLPPPSPIQLSDVCDLQAGCDKVRNTCISEYNQLTDFGGFPFLPGANKVLLKPGRQ